MTQKPKETKGESSLTSPKTKGAHQGSPPVRGKISSDQSVPKINPGPERDERNHQHDYMNPIDKSNRGQKEGKKASGLESKSGVKSNFISKEDSLSDKRFRSSYYGSIKDSQWGIITRVEEGPSGHIGPETLSKQLRW